ncbi:MAG: ion transporter [Candidatus Riflebacteria bacterium HGW-Riflebacteria-2]|jgi:voltage-gated potassium channel|nr:MAG: ion transporter [Candidatus Riflebacteria bacterium HGW-Riflebacteria-2]
MPAETQKDNLSPFRRKLHEIIFEADTSAGRYFDIFLILFILASVATVMLDSVQSIRQDYAAALDILDWVFTVVFTLEYIARLFAVTRPAAYARSFYGLIDLLAVLPGYISFVFPGAQYLSAVRIFRVLRVFRILKLAHYLDESDLLFNSIVASRKRITVFLMGVLTLVVFIGAIMYVIEGEENGFTSIPLSIYWAVVTLTTVGYGDMSPKTSLGQAFSVMIMIIGYGIIAIPTGIVTHEMVRQGGSISTRACPACGSDGHDDSASFCKNCGAPLD